MAETGYFSIVQYCPDHSRMEGKNAGVLLLCPATASVKSIVKVPDGLPAHVHAAGRAMSNRLASLPCDLEIVTRFIQSRANDFLMTELRPCIVEDGPENTLAVLFKELVEPRTT